MYFKMSLEFVHIKEELQWEGLAEEDQPDYTIQYPLKTESMGQSEYVQDKDEMEIIDIDRRLRSTGEQFEALIQFMEQHGDLARVRPGVQWRARADRLWRQLPAVLNAVDGGACKSLDKWKKVWSDLKTKTKRKVRLLRLQGEETLEEPPQALSGLEQRILAVLGPEAVESKMLDASGASSSGNTNKVADAKRKGKYTSPKQLQVIPAIQVTASEEKEQSSPQLNTIPEKLPKRSSLHRPPTADSRDLQNGGHCEINFSTKPAHSGATPRFSLKRGSSRRKLTKIEQKRIELENIRERYHHEREQEKLRLKLLKLEAVRERNAILGRIANVAEAWLNKNK